MYILQYLYYRHPPNTVVSLLSLETSICLKVHFRTLPKKYFRARFCCIIVPRRKPSSRVNFPLRCIEKIVAIYIYYRYPPLDTLEYFIIFRGIAIAIQGIQNTFFPFINKTLYFPTLLTPLRYSLDHS